MPLHILGISAFYHDSAATLVRDGRIVAAAQEERFSRIKHDFSFPSSAIAWCLESAGITAGELDYIAFYDKPFLKFERILETYLTFAPRGIRSFLQAIPLWLKQKLFLGETIRRELDYEGKIIFPTHHESHAASAFYPSPFREAAILTVDGVGEWDTTTCGRGFDNEIEIFTPSGSSLKSFMKNIIRSADLNRWKNYRHPQNIGGIIFNPTSKSLQGWVMISPQKIAFSAKLDIGWVKTNTKGYDSTQLLDKACKDRKIRWKGDSSIPIFYTNYSPKNFTVEKVKDFISELKNILSDIRIVKIHD